jgi:hypothetical protein
VQSTASETNERKVFMLDLLYVNGAVIAAPTW